MSPTTTKIRDILKWHGERIVKQVLEVPSTGDMWVVFEKKGSQESAAYPNGIVLLRYLGPPYEWEYGPIDLKEVTAPMGMLTAVPIWVTKCPCTLNELMHTTILYTNFDCTGWTKAAVKMGGRVSVDGNRSGRDTETPRTQHPKRPRT